jgi:hypothetical protein
LLRPDRGGGAGYLVGKVDDSLIFFVEQVAAVVEPKGANLLISNANPLRRSGVRPGSILTAVDQ